MYAFFLQRALCGAALAALLAPASGFAQTDPETLSAAVVTAPSLELTLPSELRAYGHDVEVVTAKDIQDRGYIDVSSALQAQVPGLFVSPGSGPFDYVDVSLQGSRSGDVLWLVDGVRVNNRIFNDTSPDTLPAGMVERIEVLKGGESLFYGTQGIAGAINIVTRGYSDTLDGRITAGYDTTDGYHFNGYARDSFGKHKFVAFFSKDWAEGFRAFNVFEPSATDRKRGYDVFSFGGKYGFDFTEDLRLNLQWQHIDARMDNLSASRTRRSYNDRDEDIVSARLDYTPDGPVQFFLKGYLHDWDTVYENIQNSRTTPVQQIVIRPAGSYWGYRDYGFNALAKLNLHRGLEYNIGYDYQNYRGRDDVFPIAGQTERVHAFIGQVRTTEDLSKSLRLAAGVRHNRATAGKDATVWNVSGRYNVSPAFYVEGSVATAFLLPSAEQLYYVGFPPDDYVGNPNLAPEKSKNVNLSIGGELPTGDRRLSWQITGFGRNVDNLIDIGFDSPLFPNGRYENVAGQVRVRGAEASVVAPLGDDLTLTASYTHARSRNQGSNLQRPRTPKDFAKATLRYDPIGRPYGAGATFNWTGDVYQSVGAFGRRNFGNYTVFDIDAYLFLDGAKRRHRLGARLQNVFNTDYATRLGQAQLDAGGSFLWERRGVPRVFHVNYAYAF